MTANKIKIKKLGGGSWRVTANRNGRYLILMSREYPHYGHGGKQQRRAVLRMNLHGISRPVIKVLFPKLDPVVIKRGNDDNSG